LDIKVDRFCAKEKRDEFAVKIPDGHVKNRSSLVVAVIYDLFDVD